MKSIWLVEAWYDFGECSDMGCFTTEEKAQEVKRDLEGVDAIAGLDFIKFQLEDVRISEIKLDNFNISAWATKDAIAIWELRKHNY